MKLQVLPEIFDYYSFGSLQTLQQQRPEKIFFICSVPNDYSLLVEVGNEIKDFEEVETGWRCICAEGQLLFNEIGVAAEITGSLANAAISVLVISGYKTDYFFINSDSLERGISCLQEAGHEFVDSPNVEHH